MSTRTIYSGSRIEYYRGSLVGTEEAVPIRVTSKNIEVILDQIFVTLICSADVASRYIQAQVEDNKDHNIGLVRTTSYAASNTVYMTCHKGIGSRAVGQNAEVVPLPKETITFGEYLTLGIGAGHANDTWTYNIKARLVKLRTNV